MQTPVHASPRRLGERRLAPPRPLAALLVIVAVVGLCWTITVSPWQSPDELDHYAYAQNLAENFAIPGAANRSEDSSDEHAADAAVGASRGAFFPTSAPPDWNRSEYAAYLAAERSRARPTPVDGGGPNGASSNPPTYYLYADIGYLLDHGGTAFGRLYAMRAMGIVLLLLTTVAGWLLAGEILGPRRSPQLACAAMCGLLPMTTFISTSINPDAMLIALWTLALWLGARVINRRAPGVDTIALCAVLAAAILTKATSYALAPAVLLALIAGWLRRPRAERRRALLVLGTGGAVLAGPVLAWLALANSLGRPGINSIGASAAHPFNLRQFASYVWQFYLPRLPFLTPLKTTPELSMYAIWLRQGLGMFGWLDVYLPRWTYTCAAVLLVGLGLATAGLLIRGLRGIRTLTLFGFLALALLSLLILLHLSEYLLLLQGGGPFLQGRYLLPVVGLLGLAVGLIVRELPLRLAIVGGATTITVLLVLQVLSLSAVTGAYYL